MQNFPRILQNYLIFNAFFGKFLVKGQKNFEKSQENFSKRSGKSHEKFLSLTCGNHVVNFLCFKFVISKRLFKTITNHEFKTLAFFLLNLIKKKSNKYCFI